MKKTLNELAREFAKAVVDGAKSQLRLMSEVRGLARAPDGAIASQYEALLREHHEDPEYAGRLREAVAAKLESERRAADQWQEQRAAQARDNPGDGGHADRLFENLQDSLERSREARIRKLERLLASDNSKQELTSSPTLRNRPR